MQARKSQSIGTMRNRQSSLEGMRSATPRRARQDSVNQPKTARTLKRTRPAHGTGGY